MATNDTKTVSKEDLIKLYAYILFMEKQEDFLCELNPYIIKKYCEPFEQLRGKTNILTRQAKKILDQLLTKSEKETGVKKAKERQEMTLNKSHLAMILLEGL